MLIVNEQNVTEGSPYNTYVPSKGATYMFKDTVDILQMDWLCMEHQSKHVFVSKSITKT